MKIGDSVLVQGDGYSFDGKIGIVVNDHKNGFIEVVVPAYNPDCTWFVSPNGWRRAPFWTDRLEAEKELDILLAKYAA